MSQDYDFPVRWHRNLITKAKDELREAERHLAALHNSTTRYYAAHQLIVQMRRAALDAMMAIPEPKGQKP